MLDAVTLATAWITARSVARGLPMPVEDHGGYRVDTGTEAEVCRWVYPAMSADIAPLLRAIKGPRHFVKLFGPPADLAAVLPTNWRIHPPNHFMIAGQPHEARALAAGYTLSLSVSGPVACASISAPDGSCAAEGFGANAAGVFIYDRIVTAPAHRRLGLATAILTALATTKTSADAPELLVATDDGRALYTQLGWTMIGPYSTASIAAEGA
jgi:GNAT superfamily N-acetyltransferase